MKLLKYGAIAFFLFFFCNWCGLASAQPLPEDPTPVAPVTTMFHAVCQQSLGDLHLRIHFGYWSDGVEDYVAELINLNPNIGTASINVPELWTTEVGLHDDFYLDLRTEDTPYTYYVKMTGVNQTITLPLNTWDTTDCPDGLYDYVPVTPEPTLDVNALHPTAVPDPTDCPAMSYDTATGTMICLWDLPYAPTPSV